MRILISGSSGLIGSHLVPFLRKAGHEVKTLHRSVKPAAPDEIQWDIESRTYTLTDFEGFDAVINLAGENISSHRWSQQVKQKIFMSRSVGTEILSEVLSTVENPPKVFINASAVGYYGDSGDAILTEDAYSGPGFLAFVCREWESATFAAFLKEIRVVKLRLGVVLSPDGGMLKSVLTPFKWGLGGVVGSGKQYISWIDIEDLLAVISFVLTHEEIFGPVNAVSPHPVTNKEFTKTLGRVLKRPTIFPIPAFAVNLIFGEMAQELLLNGQRAVPEILEKSGFHFHYGKLEDSLRHLLGRPSGQ